MAIFVACVVFIHLEQKPNLNHMKKYAKHHKFYDDVMLDEKNKIFEYIQYLKSLRVLLFIM